MTKYEEFRFSDMGQVFSFSLGLSGHFLLKGLPLPPFLNVARMCNLNLPSY